MGNVAIIALLMITTATPVLSPAWAVSDPVLRWTPGWDVCINTSNPCTVPVNEQLNFATSEIAYLHPSSSHTLILDYSLLGARPNQDYPVGFHLFWPSTSQCISRFGQAFVSPNISIPSLTPSNCDTATRQTSTRVFEVFELGKLHTNSFGNGALGAIITNIPSGTYELEFHVRSCGICAGVPFSDVIFQSPGPVFGAPGSTVFITIP